MLNRFRLRARIRKDGSLVETKFLVYLNNQEPIVFSSRDELKRYLSDFRKENDIFKLQIFRTEVYSL